MFRLSYQQIPREIDLSGLEGLNGDKKYKYRYLVGLMFAFHIIIYVLQGRN